MSFVPTGTVYGTLLNFRGEWEAWAAKMGEPPYNEPPKAPVLYIKPANTWSVDGADIPLPARVPVVEVGATIAMVMKALGAPRVEVELAFVLKRKLEGSKISVDDVLDATEYVTPAIEVIDARIEQFDRHTSAMRKVQDTISDNAANAGIVLGGRKMHPRALDLPWCGAILDAGEVVLAGSFTRPVAARTGDVFDADYGRLGRFEFRFV